MKFALPYDCRRLAGVLLAAAVLSACAPLSMQPAPPVTVSQLRFIGEQRLPANMAFQGSVVGGLSGIDYDKARGDWVMVSDDRSERSPARYYRARLDFDASAFKGVHLESVITLRQPDGSAYPAEKALAGRAGIVADLEAMRVDPVDGSIWYASEGDVALGLKPFVRHAAADGAYLSELPLPPLFDIDAAHRFGPRDNQSIEGLSFAPDGQSLWASLEGPMYQDGDLPTPAAGAINRISRFGRDGRLLGQYGYRLGAIPAAPGKDKDGKGRYADNGISEILALGETRLLVLERSAVQNDAGVYRVYVRVYEIDTAGATDIAGLASLRGASYREVTKRLVLDMDSLRLPKVDNLEGMGLGPALANGHRSLVLISDDNFSKSQVTQLLLFEVIP
jgi:hypothetical protein